jgi:hypothetical protein
MLDTSAFHHTTVRAGYAECTCGWHSSHVFGDPGPFAAWHRRASVETIDNPYLHAFLAPISEVEIASPDAHGYEYLAACLRRNRLVAEYAWAIPTEDVVRKIAALSPICELGCGTGYWAKLLRDVGAKILAVDAKPPLEGKNFWHRPKTGPLQQPTVLRHFVDVVRGDVATFDVPPEQTLMLCWPPFDNGMASQALARYSGSRVIYIGEGKGGCTGDDDFHTALAEQWKLDTCYEIPQWEGLHDDVRVYSR